MADLIEPEDDLPVIPFEVALAGLMQALQEGEPQQQEDRPRRPVMVPLSYNAPRNLNPMLGDEPPLSDMGPQPGQAWPSGYDPAGGRRFVDMATGIATYPVRRARDIAQRGFAEADRINTLPPEEREAEMLRLGKEAGPYLADAAIGMAMPAGLGLAGKALRYAPRTIAGVGGLTLGSSEISQAQSPKSDEETVRLQQKLKALGYYSGPIDGVMGSGTRNAVAVYEAAETKRRADELEAAKVSAEQAKSAAEQQRAQAELERVRLEQAQADESNKRREEGARRLEEMEDNLSPLRKAFRSYGPMIGYGAGMTLGGIAKAIVNRAYNRGSAATTARANALLGTEGDLADRTARVNQFWSEGQRVAEPIQPFKVVGGRNPIVSNPLAPEAALLYQPNKRNDLLTDLLITGGALTDAGIGFGLEILAANELKAATEAANADPSEINIRRLQAAKDMVAGWQTMRTVGLGGAGVYALGSKIRPRKPSRPDVREAEAERIRIEKEIAQQASRSAAQERRAARVLPPEPPSQARSTSATAAESQSVEPMSLPQQPTGRVRRGTPATGRLKGSAGSGSSGLPEGYRYDPSGKGAKVKDVEGKYTVDPRKEGVQIDDTKPLTPRRPRVTDDE